MPLTRQHNIVVNGQRGGGMYQGIQQPTGGAGFDSATDPNGTAIQMRGLQNAMDYNRAETEKNPFHMPGPLPDPKWEGWKQAMFESGGADHVGVGPSPEGSKQFTGESTQPGQNMLTTFGNPAGVTQGGAVRAAVPGAGDPSWLGGSLPSTQDMYKRRQQQAISGLQEAK